MNKTFKPNGLGQIFAYLGNKKSAYMILTCLSNVIVSICYNIVLAIVLQKVLDGIAYRNRDFLYQGVAIALASFAVAFIFEPVVSRMRNHCVRNTISQIREKVFCSITEMPVKTYETMERGDILTKITSDIETLEDIYLYHLHLLSFALIHGGIAAVLMLFYNVPLGLFSLFLGALQSFINYKTSGRVEQAAQNRQKSRASLVQTVVDTLDGRIDIRLSGAERFFGHIFSEKSSALAEHERMVEKKKALIENTDNFFENMNYVAILGLGLYMVLCGNITLGTIVAIKSLQGNATFLFSNLSSFMSGIAEAMPSAARIAQMLDLPQAERTSEIYQVTTMPESGGSSIQSDISEALNIQSCSDMQLCSDMGSDTDRQTAIEIRNVSFGYSGRDEILHGLSCRIESGKLAVIMGDSGTGKSTLFKLLLGFYDLSEGEYYLFGKNVQKSGGQFIRSLTAYVDQSCSLFSMSVADNVRLGRPGASDEDVIEACLAADAHEFIEKLPDQYDTMLIGGENLSGGQRQRIALARAFVSGKPILLIDEGTANLDAASERKIIESVIKMKGKRTIVVIAHRKSWEECADEVYRLQERQFG